MIRVSRSRRQFLPNFDLLESLKLMSVVAPSPSAGSSDQPTDSSYPPSSGATGSSETDPEEEEGDDIHRSDYDDAFRELRQNPDFNMLYNRISLSLNISTKFSQSQFLSKNPIIKNREVAPDLLGLTFEDIKDNSPKIERVFIFLDSPELKILRDSNSPDYKRLLKETIVH